MSITAPSITTPVEAAAADTTNVPYPAGLNAGDALVLVGSHNAPTGTVDPLSGWTEVFDSTAAGGTAVPGLYVAIKYAVGNETGSLTVSHPTAHTVSWWQMLAFSGVNQTTMLDVAAGVTDPGGGSGSIALPALSIRTAGSALVYACALSGSGNTASPPAGFTETGDKSATGTRSATVGYKLNAPLGTTGTPTVTFTGSGTRLGVIIALRPSTASRIWMMLKSGVWTGLDEVRF